MLYGHFATLSPSSNTTVGMVTTFILFYTVFVLRLEEKSKYSKVTNNYFMHTAVGSMAPLTMRKKSYYHQHTVIMGGALNAVK